MKPKCTFNVESMSLNVHHKYPGIQQYINGKLNMWLKFKVVYCTFDYIFKNYITWKSSHPLKLILENVSLVLTHLLCLPNQTLRLNLLISMYMYVGYPDRWVMSLLWSKVAQEPWLETPCIINPPQWILSQASVQQKLW